MSDASMEALLKSHFARMNEIETQDIEHTRQVQGTIKHIAERCVPFDLQVADKLEPETKKETIA